MPSGFFIAYERARIDMKMIIRKEYLENLFGLFWAAMYFVGGGRVRRLVYEPSILETQYI